MSFIDLHIHTNFSDGSFSPQEVVEYAHHKGLSAIAITDHDTTDGIKSAQESAQKKSNIEVISGIELSAYLSDFIEDEIHILGYLVEWENEKFQRTLSFLKEKRIERAKEILKKLYCLGVMINEERLFHLAGKSAIGRLHFAQIMIEDGYVSSIRDAFVGYLGEGRPAFVPKMYLSPKEAIKIISDVKGISVLAHPKFWEINSNVIKKLVDQGLRGIEVFCNKLSDGESTHFQNLAKENNILITGGSDCHGKIGNRNVLMGNVKVSYNILEQLKKYKRENFS